MASETEPAFYAFVDYQDAYIQPLILSALQNRFPSHRYQLIESLSERDVRDKPFLQITAYESLDFELARKEKQCMINSYVIRKALIRKHYLSSTTSNWIAKHPDSVLKRHFKPAVDFELDYAEFLDEALVEAYEIRESFERNRARVPEEREWWILKPGMTDRGQGIRLFSTEDELRYIFETWEAECPDSDDDDGTGNGSVDDEHDTDNVEAPSEHIITSQLRHFIAQPYIHPPLLFAAHENRKFHIRTYVLAVGSLRVYVYKQMLALFASKDYTPAWRASGADLGAHLTNTCLQGGDAKEDSVVPFWELPDEVEMALASNFVSNGERKSGWKSAVFEQICNATSAVFEAAARGMMVHFQPLRNAFEIFGLDFLVDADCNAWLLECNSFPDFRQTGEESKHIVQSLFEDVVDVAIKPFFGLDDSASAGTERIRLVLDIDLGDR